MNLLTVRNKAYLNELLFKVCCRFLVQLALLQFNVYLYGFCTCPCKDKACAFVQILVFQFFRAGSVIVLEHDREVLLAVICTQSNHLSCSITTTSYDIYNGALYIFFPEFSSCCSSYYFFLFPIDCLLSMVHNPMK